MSGWLQKWQPALLHAFQTACEKIEDEFTTELGDKDDEIRRLSMLVSKVDQLQEENSSLKLELLELRKQQQQQQQPPGFGSRIIPCDERQAVSSSAPLISKDSVKARQPLRELSPNKIAALPSRRASEPPSKEMSLRGEEAYAMLLERHTIIRDAQAKTLVLAKKYRKDRDNWFRYAEQLEAKVQRLKQQLEGYRIAGGSLLGLGKAFSTLGTETEKEIDIGKQSNRPVLNPSFASNPEPEELLGGDDPDGERANASQGELTSMVPIDDQSTEEEGDTSEEEAGAVEELPPILPGEAVGGRVAPKIELSSDEPVIISERSLKRKREGHNESANLRRIKSEHSSSGPEITGEQYRFVPHESQDLDDMPSRLSTPRKPRPVEGQDNQNDDDPTELSRTHRAAPLAPVSVDGARNLLHETARFVSDAPGSAKSTHLETNLGLESEQEHSLDRGVAELAEDGSIINHDLGRPAQARDPKSIGLSGSKLNSLLNNPSMDRNTVLLKTVTPSRYNHPGPFSTDIPPRRELPFGRNAERRNGLTPATTEKLMFPTPPLSAGVRADPARLKEGGSSTPNALSAAAAALAPLRQRSISDLKLGDFKVNPKFNAGLGYAFSDVVRNKSDRSELAGCTDPNCCGKHFRALAQSELEAGGPSILQRAADVTMLEDYLGDEAYRLGSMSRDEKLGLWLEAKAKSLADKFGRHRHRFAPQASPPGYWDVDFPNTQERAKIRGEAEARERKMVEERRREAMRPGGRWLFRDEQ